MGALASSPTLRGKRDLIESSIRRVSLDGDVPTELKPSLPPDAESELALSHRGRASEEGAREFAYESSLRGLRERRGTGLSSILRRCVASGGSRAREAVRIRVAELCAPGSSATGSSVAM